MVHDTKEARAAYQREWAKTDKGRAVGARARAKYRASDKGRETAAAHLRAYRATDKGAVVHAKASSAYKKANPEKNRARSCVSKAVKDGSLVPWPVCAVPECECTRVHAHHSCYEREMWLAVTWLCARHHKAAHQLGMPPGLV